MKEKVIKRQLNSEKDINLSCNESCKYIFHLANIHKKNDDHCYSINVKFTQPNINVDLDFKVILEEQVNIEIVVLISAESGIEGISSGLDMKALILNENASIKFVPSLEIDEMNVSIDHKSSIGSPSPQWLSYFESRGIDRDNSLLLLKKAFLG